MSIALPADPPRRAIGGFFALETTRRIPAADSVLGLWSKAGRLAGAFRNARSALLYVIETERPRRLWLPAYICPEIEAVAAVAGVPVLRFGIEADLSPRLAELDPRLVPGDAVLAVDYFGRAPSAAFRGLVASRPEIAWIEDRAQAFDPGIDPWGRWVIYSPRKILGTPDGGLVYRVDGAPTPEPAYKDDGDRSFLLPPLMRLDDGDGVPRNDTYLAYRDSEKRMSSGHAPISRTACRALAGSAASRITAIRRQNFRILAREFADIGLIAIHDPDFTPLGFPVLVPDAAAFTASLARDGLFVPRHWPRLSVDNPQFSFEARLARQEATLPCDQRYSEDDMRRLARTVRAALIEA